MAAVIKKMLPPGTTVWWVPVEHAATIEDVCKVGLYTGAQAKAVDISCAIVSGMTLNPTDSETDSTTTICDSAASNTPTRDAYEASLTFLREDLGTTGTPNPDSPATKAFNLFKVGGVTGNNTGWLVKRIGYKPGTPAAADQLISGFLVIADNPRDEVGEGNTPIQMTVPFMPQGKMFTNRKLVA